MSLYVFVNKQVREYEFFVYDILHSYKLRVLERLFRGFRHGVSFATLWGCLQNHSNMVLYNTLQKVS